MAATDLTVSNPELARLAEMYPAWQIWMSQAGRWWATRKAQISPSRNRDPGWSMTIDADTLEELGQQLKRQSLLS